MTDRKAQLVTLRAFVMLAVITAAIATFTVIVSVWPGPYRTLLEPSLTRLQIDGLTSIVGTRRQPPNF